MRDVIHKRLLEATAANDVQLMDIYLLAALGRAAVDVAANAINEGKTEHEQKLLFADILLDASMNTLHAIIKARL